MGQPIQGGQVRARGLLAKVRGACESDGRAHGLPWRTGQPGARLLVPSRGLPWRCSDQISRRDQGEELAAFYTFIKCYSS